MLQITIPETEAWDSGKEEFVRIKEQTLQLEHSLVSLSKWESKWCKAFFSKKEKTYEETLDYIKCMTITQNVNPDVYRCLTNDIIREINEYIEAPMTATYFLDDDRNGGGISREKITTELIYHWMIDLSIPFECQKWHIKRLLALIKTRIIKTRPPKKMNSAQAASYYAALNEARRKELNTKG